MNNKRVAVAVGLLMAACVVWSGWVAYAGTFLPRAVSSGTGRAVVALCDTTWVTETVALDDTTNWTGSRMFVSGGFASMTEMNFPDADVEISFWDYANPVDPDTLGTWTRITSGSANSDTVATLSAGDWLKVNERARFVVINRTSTTGGQVNRYWF